MSTLAVNAGKPIQRVSGRRHQPNTFGWKNSCIPIGCMLSLMGSPPPWYLGSFVMPKALMHATTQSTGFFTLPARAGAAQKSGCLKIVFNASGTQSLPDCVTRATTSFGVVGLGVKRAKYCQRILPTYLATSGRRVVHRY